ncbi:CpsD/CapB family tyrosine-protein kinase [Salisediminibacterium halotolerans]|uniref:CpsD/CapB family tyrosine-protein kinase n=1 Tax=Salisediminibacterium halotolerans TaxID=517425 RepID=UPI000EB25B10|nr:CpsD/CapB family tyrosine-protein kinase [Salisediminibacterium halotolerans]RLJ75729.1 capsular exopolysaccharide synthesis family protein [Actinophytocola xinjiangensis]RPE89583.1 capsular exopolysaccharide synthesis family protein [Salisediminibacterium halotolerans]TWG36342.1 capsular exopolysaccharide synthesis family protein [Salisediminibacterium halotolerans]GEL07209.1 tyrosine-protein kinase YwqD [Salisediminibacterium halotolerans]
MARKNKTNQPDMSEKQRSLITEFDQRSPVSEQFKTLRTNIQFSSIDRKLKTIMVTSSNPGEGKSTTVANLAVVMAQQHNRVLLVDTDLRKPTVHFTFQVPNHVGLSNVVTGQSTLDEAALETSIPRLDVLPSGPVPPNPSELLASKAFERFVKSVSDAYDYVIFDAPPVNAVTDPQIIASLTDGTVLVIRSGVTEIEDAQHAVANLKKVEAHLLGTVLNDRAVEKSNYYYYYTEGN